MKLFPCKKNYLYVLVLISICVVFIWGLYICGELLLQWYVVSGAKHLIKLEKQQRLSHTYGYVWQEINLNKTMHQISSQIVEAESTSLKGRDSSHQKPLDASKKKIKVIDFPSLSALHELNAIKSLYKTITVTDRYGITLVELKTTHTCITIQELPKLLVNSLIVSEDKNFYERQLAYEYKSLVRASLKAVLQSVLSFHPVSPQGSSTIHQQVARFLLMKYDIRGFAFAQRTISRKIKELKLAQALKMSYTNDEILTVYINHCVSAGRGMRGYYDISMGLFGKVPRQLDTAQNLYLARIVKWNKHVPTKIIQQVRMNLPAFAKQFAWGPNIVASVNNKLDSLRFKKIGKYITHNSHLLDLANEYWLWVCKKNGMTQSQIDEVDMSNPESTVRRFGNLNIQLTIDYRLQKLLEHEVDKRGFGNDTTIRTDKRISSSGSVILCKVLPIDTIRLVRVLQHDSTIVEKNSNTEIELLKADTLITNIRYRRLDREHVRRSVYLYKRDSLFVPGQYFSYAIMDANTQKLLAYYSKDKLGSKLSSLIKNRTPNGSCVAKPLLFALAFDCGIYSEDEMKSDSEEVTESVPWARSFMLSGSNTIGMVYQNASDEGGYKVRNYGNGFNGYDFIFNHLANSNNILAVETIFRLSTNLIDTKSSQTQAVMALLSRIGADSLKNRRTVTGTDLYASIARVVGATVDSFNNNGRRVPLPSENYSVALGTLELTLLEQMHLFNGLYSNSLVVNPSAHPSLFLKTVTVSDVSVPIRDSIVQKQLFSHRDAIQPVYLAMHKRLISNPSENLVRFDVCKTDEFPQKPLSNWAKSGTTVDLLRPYNADVKDTAKTNYGLWNATLRLKLHRNDYREYIAKDTLMSAIQKKKVNLLAIPQEQLIDVTLACIGECNLQNTGPRDGKSLHSFLSKSLLNTHGIECQDGLFAEYESKITKHLSDEERFSKNQEKSDLSFLNASFIKLRTFFGAKALPYQVRFEKKEKGYYSLESKSYTKLLSLAPFMGKESKTFKKLSDELNTKLTYAEAVVVIQRISQLKVSNQNLKREIEQICTALNVSLKELSQ